MQKYTVSQIARAAGISQSGVRLWSGEYSDYLSPGATPDKGTQRLFNNDDLAVFKTIKAMRDNLATGEQIVAALDAGERYEPEHTPQETPQEQNTSLITLDMVERMLKPYEATIARLEGELQSERAARLDAEKEASRLAGKLETIGQGDGQVGDKKSFNLWAWLKGEG